MNRLALTAALVLPFLATSSVAHAHPSDTKRSKFKIETVTSHPTPKVSSRVSFSALDRHPLEARPTYANPVMAFASINPAFAVAQFWMKASMQIWSASMAMYSPLGYGAGRGPLGY